MFSTAGGADVPALYESHESSRYGDIHWRALFALLVGLTGGWAFESGDVSLFQGPIARATDGVGPLSWLVSIVFGGLAYWALCRTETGLVSAPSVVARGRRRGRGREIDRP